MPMPEKEMKEMYTGMHPKMHKGKKKAGKKGKGKTFDAHDGANALAARLKGY